MANPNHRRLIAAIIQNGGGFAGLAGDAGYEPSLLPSGAPASSVAPSVIYPSAAQSQVLQPMPMTTDPAPMVSTRTLWQDPADQPAAVGVPSLLSRPADPPPSAAGVMPSFFDTLFSFGKSPLTAQAPYSIARPTTAAQAPLLAGAAGKWLLYGALAVGGLVLFSSLRSKN